MFVNFQLLIKAVTNSYQTLSRTKQLHAFITRNHLLHDPFYATKIVGLYANNSDITNARKVFDEIPQRSVFLWNSIIRAYAKANRLVDACLLYKNMISTEIKPDNFTYACLVRAFSESFEVEGLRVLHGAVVVSGLGFDGISCSALVTGYSKLGIVGEAEKVFRWFPEPDLVMWNSMILGYGNCGFIDKGLRLFSKMRGFWQISPDGYTMVGLINSLVNSSWIAIGQGIHCLCFKYGFYCGAHVGSALMTMYSRFKLMNSAYCVFMSLHNPDLVTWSALITGYSQSGDYGKSLHFFRILSAKTEKLDRVLITNVLVASARLADVRHGAELHAYVLRHGLELDVMVSTALIDMYSKCGFLWLGVHVFAKMSNRNVVSYNSVIAALGLHGHAYWAFETFEELLKEGLKPDEGTFSALLSACCHSGLVKEGWEIFRRMTEELFVKPRVEHYVYMIKLVGMTGQLEEAYKFIMSLEQPVDSGVWGALLSCCNAYGNSELADLIAQQLFNNDPVRSVYKVMLSNIYAGDERWDDMKRVRDSMPNAGAPKMPGLSWIGSN